MYLWIGEMFLALAGKFEQLSYTCTWNFQVSLMGFQPMSQLVRRANRHYTGHGFKSHWRHLKFFKNTYVLKLSCKSKNHLNCPAQVRIIIFLQFDSKLLFTKISFNRHSFHRNWTGITKVMGSNHVEDTRNFLGAHIWDNNCFNWLASARINSSIHLHTSLTFLSYMCIYLPVW